MSNVTEFIYFHIKPSVKPEDPSNDEGAALLQVFRSATQQSGHCGSAWGRTKEDESQIVWVIDWTSAHNGGTQVSTTTLLTPYLLPQTQINTIFTTIQPQATETATLTSNPVTELCPLAFPTSLDPSERSAVWKDLVSFRKALTENAREKDRPVSFSMGQVERPGEFPCEKSKSGQAFVYMLVVGWGSVEGHLEVKKSEAFTGAIGPIRERMLAPLKGLGMKHVKFRPV